MFESFFGGRLVSIFYIKQGMFPFIFFKGLLPLLIIYTGLKVIDGKFLKGNVLLDFLQLLHSIVLKIT